MRVQWQIRFGIAVAGVIAVIFGFQNCGQHLSTTDLTSLENIDGGLLSDPTNGGGGGGGAGVPDPDPGSGLPIGSAVDIEIGKSVMITNHKVLDRVYNKVDFGEKLSEFYAYTRKKLLPIQSGSEAKAKTAGEFIANMFDGAEREQQANADFPAARRFGDVPDADRRMGHMFNMWMSQNQMNSKNAAGMKGGPFRLLAIANLMDQAGNIDDRGTTEPTQNARAMGEIHLVYGVIDKNYENNGKPYPQTFVLSYRLPVLEWQDGELVAKSNETMDSLMKDPTAWGWKLKFWARQWASLSLMDPESNEYQARLSRILELAVQPENFMNMRSNTKINSTTFEMREWYLLNSILQLIPRKPRGEPYRCLSGGKALTKMINSFWRADKNDLDVFSYKKPAEGNANRNDNGFLIHRDIGVKFFDDFTTADGVTKKNGSVVAFDGCGQTEGNMPFDMWADNQLEKSPRVTAPYAQVKNEGEIWKLTTGTPEERRHAFAIRTCSGCHSQEGAAKGFHIFPRLNGTNSELSPFLTGQGQNQFSHGGATYKYTQLADRRKHLFRAFERQAELYEGLQRKDTD